MEWLQTTYRGTWRLTRDSDRERTGFYWYCPEDTPFYPGLHNLWSYRWTNDIRDHRTVLGDFTQGATFYDGRRPARRPLPVLVGSADCIENGEKEGLAVVNDVSAACSPILPGPCYAPLSDTHAKTDVQDCVFAKVSADIINLAYTDLDTAELFTATYLDGDISSFEQPNDLIPAGVICKIDDTFVLWLHGTANAEQLATQALYFGTGPVNFGPYSCSALYQAAALIIGDLLTAAGIADYERVVLVGHSYGGAILEVLTAIMLLADEDRDVHLMTLGAPQPGDDRLFRLIRFVDQRHWADEMDPIPFLPPRGLTFQSLIPIIGPALALLWSNFRRPDNVTILTRDGQFAEVQGDQITATTWEVIARVIAANREMPSFKDHSTAWYAYYLCLACKCVPRPCVPPEVDELAFIGQMDALNVVFNGVPLEYTFPATELPILGHFPNGAPSSWGLHIDGIGSLVILSAQDAYGDYDFFQVLFTQDDPHPAWFASWEYPAIEFLGGIDDNTFPDFGEFAPGDGVVSFGGLKIKPILV